MYNKINLYELNRVSETAKRADRIEMSQWWYETAGCLIGTYAACAENPLVIYCGTAGSIPLSFQVPSAFQITPREAGFLFWSHAGTSYPAVTLPGADAIARLDKYIAYKTRKRELWEEYDWWRSLPRLERKQHPLALV